MPPNLPPILPTSSLKPPPTSAGVPRAWNTQVSKLQQKKDIEQAKVSMSQLMRSKAAGGEAEQEPLYSDAERDAIRDRLRDRNVRKRLQEKKVAEAAAKAAGKPSKYALSAITTGRLTRRGGAFGTERQVSRMFRKYRATFKNLSPKDRKYFLDLVLPHGARVAPGKGFGYSVRKQMKMKVDSDWRKGEIKSFEDVKDFKRMIDQLQ